jgi:uncharacterized protein (TIGR03437 family)
MTKSVLGVVFLLAASAGAQTVETVPFRAVLSSNNEVPPIANTATGAATVLVHTVRDASGQLVSGSVDAHVSYKFPAAVTITAMHIHRAGAGVNGGVVVPFAIARTEDTTGTGSLPAIQTQFPAANATLATINDILANPEGFYFNVHTTEAPGGAIRGQLQPAKMIVRIGTMAPDNEVPAITGRAFSGLGTIVALITRDAAAKPTSALVTFLVNYSGFADDTTFTGLHIHRGVAGANGGVTINTGLRNLPTAAGGAGTLRYDVEADVSSAAVVSTLNSLEFNPTETYINLHTSEFTGGAIRSQLLRTDRMDFQVTMSPANEVPALTLQASTPAVVSVYTVRNSEGAATAGSVVFDANPRFPAGTQFTGLHIHDQVAGQNGPVTIDSALTSLPQLVSDGQGNIYRIAQVRTAAGLRAVNSLILNPERHYANLHTTANAGGATRAQLAGPSTAQPLVTFVASGVQNPELTTLAPGGLAFIAGSGLARVGTDLGGYNGITSFPVALNGTEVTIGGQTAPVFIVETGRAFVQVPFGVQAGEQSVVVKNANGSSASFRVVVRESAPALFFDEGGLVAFNDTAYSYVSPGTPAAAGDVVTMFATGLGQTSPAQQTGVIATSERHATAPVSVQMGGQNVPVIKSTSAPGYAGVYIITVRIPQGLGTGSVPVTIDMGGAPSNAAMLSLK